MLWLSSVVSYTFLNFEITTLCRTKYALIEIAHCFDFDYRDEELSWVSTIKIITNGALAVILFELGSSFVSIQTNKQKWKYPNRMTYIQWLWLQRWRAELSKSRKDHHEWGVGCHLIWAGVIIGTQPHRTCLHVKVMIGRGPWELRKPPGFNTT